LSNAVTDEIDAPRWPAVSDDDWSSRVPRLFGPARVDYANVDLGFTTGPFDDALVSRLHLVAVTAPGELIVCTSLQGWRFLPGGTREPQESLRELVARELLEEAGAVPLGDDLTLFGAHVADSRDAGPWRPHLAFPRALWAYGACRAEITGPPTCPPDGEQIVDVLTLPSLEAVEFIETHDQMMADAVRLAIAMHLV
jgi:8-oxo-dGTP diphosphatase